MSVLIKGMKMPRYCKKCKFRYNVTPFITKCMFTNEPCHIRYRNSTCPLAEVPAPHGDLIDRGTITAMVRKQFCDITCDRASVDCERCGVNVVIDELIGKAPIIIESED